MSRSCSMKDCPYERYVSIYDPDVDLCEFHAEDIRDKFCALVGQSGGYSDQSMVGVDWAVVWKFVKAHVPDRA